MISIRASRINPSPTLAITAKAKDMKKQGLDVVSFGAGEPDFDTPENIKQAAIQAINSGFTKYTPTGGIVELKKAICDKLKRDNSLDYEPKNILVSTGAKQCIYNILQVLINPGDEVVVPSPYWVSYEEMVKLADGKCVFTKSDNFKISGEQLKKILTNKTKLLMLNSPSNPTGVVYSRNELQEIAQVCVKNQIFVLSDEIYESLIYQKKHISIASLNNEIKKLTVVVNGVSKTYSMTGWRIGYCAGNSKIISSACALQDHSTSNPNSIAQKAALEALIGQQEIIATMKNTYKKRRNYMISRLRQIPNIVVNVPDGAFYVFVKISALFNSKINNSNEFCSQLLKQNLVAAIPGSAFGDDEYIRLSYATSDIQIEKGLDRITDFVKNLG